MPLSALPLSALPLQAVPDDGYLLVNVGYHLMAAGRHSQVGWVGGVGGCDGGSHRGSGRLPALRCLHPHLECSIHAHHLTHHLTWHCASRPPSPRSLPLLLSPPPLPQLRALLLDPAWLRRKLLSAGTPAAVADFRRYLLHNNCPDIKLVLESFQMSAPLTTLFPTLSTMLGEACSHPQMADPLQKAATLPWMVTQTLSPRYEKFQTAPSACVAGAPTMTRPRVSVGATPKTPRKPNSRS